MLLLVELPFAALPLAALPLVELPLAELPFVELPLAELPLAELPFVELPLAELPFVELPLAALPFVELPFVELPLAEFPFVELPFVELPFVELPFVEFPLAEFPFVELLLAAKFSILGAVCSKSASSRNSRSSSLAVVEKKTRVISFAASSNFTPSSSLAHLRFISWFSRIFPSASPSMKCRRKTRWYPFLADLSSISNPSSSFLLSTISGAFSIIFS